jgi:hypothetical protein
LQETDHHRPCCRRASKYEGLRVRAIFGRQHRTEREEDRVPGVERVCHVVDDGFAVSGNAARSSFHSAILNDDRDAPAARQLDGPRSSSYGFLNAF